MLKEKFIKSTLILIIGGAITKFLGMFIRIVMTRKIGIDGMEIYMLVMPTFSLFMTLSQISLPTAISKLVSEDKHNNKNIIFTSIPVILAFNLLLMILIFLIAKPVSINLLHDERCILPILAIALVLPFDSISNMLRGYFFGKQKMFPHVISHISEQIIRLILIILVIPTLLKMNLIYAVSFLVLVNLFSELLSIFVLFFFLPKNFKLTKKDITPDISNLKDILSISIPTTGSRLVGNIGYFLEPIILTSSLLFVDYSHDFIQSEYAIISGYVMPLLLLPGFFTNAISSALLPTLSKLHADKDKKGIKRKLIQAIFFSLLIGLPVTILFMMFPKTFLNMFYGTNLGTNYLRILGPVFLLFYIEAPLSSCLQAIDKSKNIMIDNSIAIAVKTLLLFVLSFFKIGIYPLIIATSLNILIVTTRHFKVIKKYLNS